MNKYIYSLIHCECVCVCVWHGKRRHVNAEERLTSVLIELWEKCKSRTASLNQGVEFFTDWDCLLFGNTHTQWANFYQVAEREWMIALCLHPSTPHPVFFPSFLSAHHVIPALECLLSVCVCVCVCAPVHVSVPPEELKCWCHSWKDRAKEKNRFFVLLHLVCLLCSRAEL